MFWLQAKFFSARVYKVIIVYVKRCVMFKQWQIQANIRLRNVSSLAYGFMKKNELVKHMKKSEKTSFFVSIKQLPVKQISKKPRPHNVWQLAVVLLKRKSFNYSDEFCWTSEVREIIRIFRTIKRASRRTWRRIQLCAENDSAHTETLDHGCANHDTMGNASSSPSTALT